MKLRNKKTNEIGRMVCTNMPLTTVHTPDGGIYSYRTLAELNEEWGDYEEPKEYWTIDWTCTGVTTNKYSGDDVDDFNKSIGNYFETKEEAELAVRKLKAWKRLKDKGFRFVEHRNTLANVGCPYRFVIEASVDACEKADLDLLFGGGE